MSPILLPQREAGLAGGDPLVAIVGTKQSQPRGLESVLEFNGVYLHDLKVIDKYRLTKIDGFHGLPDIRDAREVNPQRHGETALSAYFGGRTMVLTGKVEAHTIWKLRDMQQALKTAFGTLVEKPLIIRTPDIQQDVQIFCRPTSFVMDDQQSDYRFYREFMVTLRASDPRFVRNIETLYDAAYGALDTFQTSDLVDATNRIINPSFEVDATGWSGATRVTTWAASGSASGRYYNAGDETGNAIGIQPSVRIPVTAGETVEWSMTVNLVNPPGQNWRLDVLFYDAASGGNSLPAIIGSNRTDAAGSIVREKITGTVPAGATHAVPRLRLDSGGATGVPDVIDVMFDAAFFGNPVIEYFDGSLTARVEVADNSVNRLPNPSFEVDTAYWSHYGSSGSGSTLTRDTSTSYSGIASLRRYANGNSTHGEGIVSNPVPVAGGRDYVFSGYLRSPGTVRNFYLIMLYRDAAGNTVQNTSSPAMISSSEWQRISFATTAPANATSVLCYVSSNAPMAQGELHYFDALMLHEGTAPLAYEDTILSSKRFRWSGTPHASTSERLVGDVLADRWVYDSGGGTMSVKGGVLIPHTTAEKQLYRSPHPRQADSRVQVKVNVGSGGASTGQTDVIVKRLDVNNYVYVQRSPTALSIGLWDGGLKRVVKSVTGLANPALNAPYWLRGTMVGNQITAEVFTSDPAGSPAPAPASSTTYTLNTDANSTQADIDKFGTGITGDVGLKITPGDLTWSYDDFQSEPLSLSAATSAFTIRNSGNFEALPVVRIYGPVTDPVLRNNTTGKVFKLTGQIPGGGAFYEIDFARRTVKDNTGASKYGQVPIDAEFFGLIPQHEGDNDISLSASVASTTLPALRVYHRDTWI